MVYSEELVGIQNSGFWILDPMSLILLKEKN
jgi:hypothetical protein